MHESFEVITATTVIQYSMKLLYDLLDICEKPLINFFYCSGNENRLLLKIYICSVKILQVHVLEKKTRCLHQTRCDTKASNVCLASFSLRNRVLQISSGLEEPGSVNWEMALCLLLGWIICYLCVWKGVKSTGRVCHSCWSVCSSLTKHGPCLNQSKRLTAINLKVIVHCFQWVHFFSCDSLHARFVTNMSD